MSFCQSKTAMVSPILSFFSSAWKQSNRLFKKQYLFLFSFCLFESIETPQLRVNVLFVNILLHFLLFVHQLLLSFKLAVKSIKLRVFLPQLISCYIQLQINTTSLIIYVLLSLNLYSNLLFTSSCLSCSLIPFRSYKR